MTDPHLFGDTTGSFRGTVTHASLSDVIRHYGSGDWQADLVTATGDLIQDESAGAYERFIELIKPLDLPVHCVPGNHDIRKLMQKALSTPPFFYCDATEIDNWLIIGYAALFPSTLAYLCWNLAVPVVGANLAAITQYLNPVFAITLAALILGERVATYHLVGIAAILAGIYLSGLSGSRRRRKERGT